MKKKLCFYLLCCCLPFFVQAQNAMPNFNLNRIGGLAYNEALSGVWGYEKNGHKYAIVGIATGYSIVDIDNPNNCIELNYADKGANNYWSEVQIAGDYVLGVADGTASGLYIADLSNIENGIITDTFVYPEVPTSGAPEFLYVGHALFVDENNILYISGSNINSGNVVMFDITDPYNPVFLGTPSDQNYAHDCYVRGDTLWAAHMYQGGFTAYDISNKANPIYLGFQNTPSNFTHNIGISTDGNTLFTTDERAISWLAAYDISDMDNIKELDRYRTRGEAVESIVPHNVYIKDDYAILAHYTDGLVVLDVSRPQNIVEVAYYSTYTGSDSLFNGAWGAYPFYNDNTIIVGDIQTGLHIFEPTYARAAWLEGMVYDINTNDPIFGARVQFVDNNRLSEITKLDGLYATGKGIAGTYNLRIEKEGYYTEIIAVSLENGVLKTLNIPLRPWAVGIEENTDLEANFSVYPNPFNSSFFIEKSEGETSISIYNTLGQLVEFKEVSAQDTKVEMGANLPSGQMYIIQMPNSLSQKIIKK